MTDMHDASRGCRKGSTAAAAVASTGGQVHLQRVVVGFVEALAMREENRNTSSNGKLRCSTSTPLPEFSRPPRRGPAVTSLLSRSLQPNLSQSNSCQAHSSTSSSSSLSNSVRLGKHCDQHAMQANALLNDIAPSSPRGYESGLAFLDEESMMDLDNLEDQSELYGKQTRPIPIPREECTPFRIAANI